jgi:hypothetical protein
MDDEPTPPARSFDEDLLRDWERAPSQVRGAIEQAVDHGTPALSVAVYSRWWQLETWLRQLVYLEFRAKWGGGWSDHLVPSQSKKRLVTAARRAEADSANRYMATPDATNVMSYVDVSVLFDLIDENWSLFEKCLLPKTRWDGWVEEVQQVRNRNAHCRRPHDDDLGRIEQLLRDLEDGAWRALIAHNVDSELQWIEEADPVVAGWVKKQHEAAHLVDHAARNHSVDFRLTWSKRPWATYEKGETITGREGFFIHATFHLQQSFVLPRMLWDQFGSPKNVVQQGLVYLLADSPYSPSFTFAAVDGGDLVNAEIANAFNAVMVAKRGGNPPKHWLDSWRTQSAVLDHRVLVDSALNVAYPDTPFPIFWAR